MSKIYLEGNRNRTRNTQSYFNIMNTMEIKNIGYINKIKKFGNVRNLFASPNSLTINSDEKYNQLVKSYIDQQIDIVL